MELVVCEYHSFATSRTVLTRRWSQDGRAELRMTMLDEANAKRRKLDREKRFIDRPQEGEFFLVCLIDRSADASRSQVV